MQTSRLEKLIEYLVNQKPGDNYYSSILKILCESDPKIRIGYFLLYSTVEKEFSISEVFPHYKQNSILEKIQNKINIFNSSNELKTPFPHCGLFYYLAYNYFKNGKKEPILYRSKSNHILKDYHLDLQYFDNEEFTEFIIPIFSNHSETNEHLHGFLILVGNVKDDIFSLQDLYALSNYLSFGTIIREKIYSNKSIIQFVNTIDNIKESKKETSLGKVFSSIDKIFIKNELNNCNLKFASFWLYNETNTKNPFLVKEYQLHTNQLKAEIPTIISKFKKTPSNNLHLFFKVIDDWNNKIRITEEIKFDSYVFEKQINEIAQEFYNYDQLIHSANISQEDKLVLFPVFTKGKKNHNNIIGIIALYFSGNSNQYFYRPEILELISNEIQDNYVHTIHEIRKQLRLKIIDRTPLLFSNHNDFFKECCCIISDQLYCEGVSFYVYDEESNVYKLLAETGEQSLPNKFSITSRDYSTNDHYLYDLISELSDGVSEYSIFNPTSLYRDIDTSDNPSSSSSYLIYNLVGPSKKKLVFLFVKTKEEIFQHNTLRFALTSSIEDSKILRIGIETIGICFELFNHFNTSEKIFSKIAHEIPSQTDVILQNIRELEDIISQNQNGLSPHANNVLNLTRYSAMIIKQYSEISRLRFISKDQIRPFREEIDLRLFFNSFIEVFRVFARLQGIFIEFELKLPSLEEAKISAHPTIILALVNVINNAIQYSHFGSNVLIKYNVKNKNHSINVTNIGIELPENLHKAIFEEYYRTNGAKEKYFAGTGFGLSVVQKIIAAHDGTIDIISYDQPISERNILGLAAIEKFLQSFPKREIGELFLGTNLNDIALLTKSLNHMKLTEEENRILRNYSKFSITESNRVNSIEFVKDFLKRQFEGHEDILSLYKKFLQHGLYKVEFLIQFKG